MHANVSRAASIIIFVAVLCFASSWVLYALYAAGVQMYSHLNVVQAIAQNGPVMIGW